MPTCFPRPSLAAQAAGLTSVLADPNLAATVFAPTNEAFVKALSGERPSQHAPAVPAQVAASERLAALPPARLGARRSALTVAASPLLQT